VHQHGSPPTQLSYNMLAPSADHATLPPVLLLRGGTAEGPLKETAEGARLWNGFVGSRDRLVVAPFFNSAKDIGRLKPGETAAFGFLRRGLPELLARMSTNHCGGQGFQVIAESNGGVLAYVLAREHPKLVASLLILSSAPSNEELPRVPQLAHDDRRLPVAAFVSAKDSAFLRNAKASQATLTRAGLQPAPALTVVDKKGFVHEGCEVAVGRDELLAVLRSQTDTALGVPLPARVPEEMSGGRGNAALDVEHTNG